MTAEPSPFRLRAGPLAWAAAGAMGLAAALGPLLGDAAAFRWVQIGLVAVCLGFAAAGRLDHRAPLPRAAWLALLAASLLWVEGVALSRWLGFAINGVDFSIFDWMLESTVRGRLGYSPIYAVNHLGVHSSALLLGLTPLYLVAPSPLWLLFIGPLLVWLGVFPLARLVRWASGGGEPAGLLLLGAVLAWLGNAYLGRLVNDGFRIENGLPVLALWLLVGWVERRRGIVALALAGLLLTKEDTALWLISFALGAVAVERARWREAGAIALVAGGFLVLYLGLVQPRLVALPAWAGFWSQFGPTPARAALGMLRHPLEAVFRIGTSGVWGLLAPLLFLPLLSKRAVAGLAPGIVLLGTATYEAMHRYGTYYPSALVPLALFGVLDVQQKRRIPEGLALLALAAFPLFHDGYARSARVELGLVTTLEELKKELPATAHLCVQPVLFPHLGYPPELEPLFDARCAERADAVTLVNTALDPWPLTREQLDALLRRLAATHHVAGPRRGFYVVTPAAP